MESAFTVHPIGVLRSSKGLHFQALHQPDESADEQNLVELFPRPGMREALQDLEGMERIWLIGWFDRVEGWRPLVLPPRGPARRRGVLATRSPHRPNPIGMTPVRLLSVDGLRLRLGPCDLLDGTPILDVKPYVPAFDAFAGSRAGWIDEVEAQMSLPARFTVTVESPAREQLDWLLRDWGVEIETRMQQLLAVDPSPHRSRRIRALAEGWGDIGCGAWRAIFQWNAPEGRVQIRRIEPSFPLRFLLDPALEKVPDRQAQLAFLQRWSPTVE
jgi:tRNA-Thr(GGU) m(6)t(6)A37 methyltransferase TsaA